METYSFNFKEVEKNIVLDDKYYSKLICDNELEYKFNELIKDKYTTTYDKYAFLQHACSYSPLLDFTKNSIVARSFALSNTSKFNEFKNHAAVVISMATTETPIERKKDIKSFLQNEFYLDVIDSNYFILGNEYRLERVDGTFKTIKIMSICELINALTPKVKILDYPTNDRMKYQDGLFACFYGCLCLEDFMLYNLTKTLSFGFDRIPYKSKRKILNDIYAKYRKYDPEHLMSPYLYFNE